MKKKLIILLVFMMLFSNIAYAGGWFLGASDWAEPELQKALDNGLITHDDFAAEMKAYSDYISRAEFAKLIMNMYYQMTESYPELASADTFSDTTNKYVLMANAAEIINGKGNGIFKPYDLITRQEMAVMMSRALDSMNIDYYTGDGVLTVADKDSVSGWAVKGVDFAFENGFIKGDGTNFKPLNNTPIEQAVIIVNRVYEKYASSIKPSEPKDYSKGYSVSKEDGNGYITYSNGEKELVRENVVFIDYLRSDIQKLYVVTSDKNSYRYNVSDMTYDTLAHTTHTQDMRIVQGGEYDGYLVVKTLVNGVTEYKVLCNNKYNSYENRMISSFDNMSEQIANAYADNDYTKGYSLSIEKGKSRYTTLHITYDNTGIKENLKLDASKYYTCQSNPRYFYYETYHHFTKYDLETGTKTDLITLSTFGSQRLGITAFGYVDGGEYDGYVIIRGSWGGYVAGDRNKPGPTIIIIDPNGNKDNFKGKYTSDSDVTNDPRSVVESFYFRP
ncbi:MAG: S-layer homology domain-containing protein [Vallitalea sp.]|jgi:hypothetical protein|nr:S-layer homology domain-containing protein [Vallitalea sp.]